MKWPLITVLLLGGCATNPPPIKYSQVELQFVWMEPIELHDRFGDTRARIRCLEPEGPKNYCTIYTSPMEDYDDSYALNIIGHEVGHAIYGPLHQRGIRLK